ncbi:MAG: hypothetical protein GIW97_05095 [Candidatus Eremiobacteraeota bacterium]|nr:hypothetical protein [Candidatus Eremiobacteraeota bacterium]
MRGLLSGLGGLFGLVLLACASGPAAAQAAPPNCWDVTYAALRHRAAAPHPPYITYAESAELIVDGKTLMQSRPQITYRDDGALRIDDDGFVYVTRNAVPGPPELGPYGNRRSMWLPMDDAADPSLPLIGTVHSRNRTMSCANEGIELYKDHETYRLAFNTVFPNRPSLKALWVDTRTSEIWKVIVSGAVPVGFSSDERRVGLADFEVELAPYDNYVVVNHVTWKFNFREYSQTATFFGEYYYHGFEFPKVVPAGFFSSQISTSR